MSTHERSVSEAGGAAGAPDSPRGHPARPGWKTFVMIFRQGPRELTGADLARRRQEISAWARVQNAAGHNLDPRPLGPGVRRPGSVADAAGADGWPVTALVFLEAEDLDAAARVAACHPAHNYTVSVEVRPWAPPEPAAQ